MKSVLRLLFAALGLTLTSVAAHAQSDEPLSPEAANAQLEVRINALEEQMRSLNGKLEESQFQNRKLSENLEKIQRDADYRFTQLEQQNASEAAAAQAASEAAAQQQALQAAAHEEVRKPVSGNQVAVKDTATGTTVAKPVGTDAATKQQVAAPAPKEPVKEVTKEAPKDAAKPNDGQQFATPRDHYNYAFRLLNQTKYDEAAASFKSFLKKNPKDPLAGNASYWLGETQYLKRDYVTAADNFRQGYESSPPGPKAADNLLKLAMSLDQMKQNKQACVVLSQVVSKFGKTSANAARKAETEQKRIGCQ